MNKDEDPESSPAHEVEPDPEEEARRIILARRARFVAVALVSAGVGTASCGGQTSDGQGSPQPCLEPMLSTGGTGGVPQPCLSIALTGGAPQVCLGVSASGGAVTYGGSYGAGGVPQPCLQPPPGGSYGYGGVPQPCLTPIPTGGAPQIPSDAGADAASDAAPVPCLTVDAAPVPCLSIPAIPSSDKGS